MCRVLIRAIKTENIEKVKESIKKKEDNIQAVSKKGYRDIHMKLTIQLSYYIEKAVIESVKYKQIDIIKYLVEHYKVCLQDSFILNMLLNTVQHLQRDS